MARQRYPTDLTDRQWQELEALLPLAKPGGRPRSVDVREIMNAILYVARNGVVWRALPHDFPPGARSNTTSGPGASMEHGSGSTTPSEIGCA
jgi:transposase